MMMFVVQMVMGNNRKVGGSLSVSTREKSAERIFTESIAIVMIPSGVNL